MTDDPRPPLDGDPAALVAWAARRSKQVAAESGVAAATARGEAILAAREEAANRDQLARAILEETHGLSEADLDSLTADERAKAAGLTDDAPPANTFEANLGVLSDADREWLNAGAKL